MKRTSILAEEELLERLRAIARREQISFAEVIRQALERRVAEPGRPLRLIGVGASAEEPGDTGRRAGELEYEPRSWR